MRIRPELVKIAYQQGSERLIVVLTQKKALTAEEQADIRSHWWSK